MTNREKYIDNASNENLVATIISKISTMPRFSSIDGFTDAGEELIEWLSQEAEEDIPKTASELKEKIGTDPNSVYILKEIYTLQNRIDKLEEMSIKIDKIINDIDFIDGVLRHHSKRIIKLKKFLEDGKTN